MSDEQIFMSGDVPPLAAAFLVRNWWRHLDEVEAHGNNLVASGRPDLGGPLLRYVRTTRRAGRERLEAARASSGGGTTEVPSPWVGTPSEHSLVSGLTAGEVAEKYGVSASWVTRNCRSGTLSATWRGRQWVVDEVSAAEYFGRREERAG